MSGTGRLPAALGRYQPVEALGAGAMGTVYLAIDPLIDRRVAIKVINAEALEQADREEFLARFRTEVRAAAQCVHPAIVGVYDFADDGPMPYIVMEYVPGTTLSALLRQPAEARAAAAPGLAAAMTAVLEALGGAHGVGVVHRDIKPGNIMVTPRGAVKITDFGIARFGASALTMVGGVIGTPSYMAPEQALGQAVDHRADLFSAAAVLYEILLGRPPFAARSMAETLLRLTGPDPAELGALEGTAMGAVLRQGLAKQPAQRFGTAGEFLAALRPALLRGEALPPEDATRLLPMGSLPFATALPATNSGTSPGFALPAGAQAKATEALAYLVGPLARVLVQKALARAVDGEDFVRLVCTHVAPAEAAGLRRKLLVLL